MRKVLLSAVMAVAIVVPALLTGFVVSPLWYLWLGLRLRRRDAADGR